MTLLDYLRFSGSEYQKFALSLLINEDLNDEIRYAAIRYLGKYPFSKAYEALCGFAEENSEQKWEYAAIASTALGSYPCENTVHILKKNLYSRNMYVTAQFGGELEKSRNYIFGIKRYYRRKRPLCFGNYQVLSATGLFG